jgi:hypothetical protein
MALVAATTVGLDPMLRLRAEVSAAGHALPSDASEYRLIVQSYLAQSVVDGIPSAHARPLASAQRSVRPDELARGVAVDVVGLDQGTGENAVIVAWLEPGSADLDFDARKARPSRNAYVGVAVAESAQAQVVLTRKLG